MKILMTGATGLVGRPLGLKLVQQGHELVVVSRSRRKALLELPFPCDIIEHDLVKEPLAPGKLVGIDAVIHLMGEGVAESRWNTSQKRKIFDSRILGTRHLVESFSSAELPKVFISASGIGYYGDGKDTELFETLPAGSDFLAQVCVEWEKEAQGISEKSGGKNLVRVVNARLGMVIAQAGGALDKMRPLFQSGVGASLGSGNQWMSWIHLNDVVNLFIFVLENAQISGPVNFCSPKPAKNLDFTNEMAAVLNRPLGPSVTAFALKLLYGEMSEVLLFSQRAKPDAALKAGFQFEFPELTKALEDVLAAQAKGEELLKAQQYLPYAKEKIFEFFADAQNLEKITPDDLRFHILEMSTPQIQKGTLIDYKLKIQGVPVGWKTEITVWNPPHEFVDVALKGPYKSWHHTHTFENLGPGTLMTDTVRYQLPLGFVGWIAAYWKVKKDLKKIFDFRRKAVAEHFAIR